ncbi:MAG: histidine--tRNA ligase [Candidatus Omnitrophica bacterium]|nr:histidine--tRNA ligase [Candidatus Omnitrophota bacterium]
MEIKTVRGMKDILPGEVARWERVEQSARSTLRAYGFEEIRTPVLEATGLFERAIGQATDIVSKEMYTFNERGGASVSLRPEATASVCRAYVEHHMNSEGALAKLYLIGPMFRTERPQAGRQRQFHQISAEAIGCAHPLADVEMITLLSDLLIGAGADRFTLLLNSVGCGHETCRARFVTLFTQYLKAHLPSLCPECRGRYPKRVWRILDCKKEGCRKVTRGGPSLAEHIRTAACDCGRHFETVQKGLKASGVAFQIEPCLVRGLDYYTKTAFEVVAQGLGAQDAVAAGGRYDGLVELLGGPQVGGVGMAIGLERLMLALEAGGKNAAEEAKGGVYVALLGESGVESALHFVRKLREGGVPCHMAFETSRSLKSQLREADRLKLRSVVMLGEREMERQVVTVKDLVAREQKELPIRELVAYLTRAVQ